MSTPPPSYLKLHTSDHDATGDVCTSTLPRSATGARRTVNQADESKGALEGFWRAYTETTGWRIDPAEPTRLEPVAHQEHAQAIAKISGALATTSDAITADAIENSHGMSAADARRLANAAQALAEQLQQQQTELRLHQLELAARAAVILDIGKATNGNEKMDMLMADATLATGTDAAAIYLLDEDTERLATRFVFGMSPLKRLGTSRPLRGARGDLETMIQGVVAMEDLRPGPIDQYCSPEPYASAICVCLGSTDLPIGTMWLFSDKAQSYGDHATAAARLAATDVCYTLAALGDREPVPAPPSLRVSADQTTATDFVDMELERMLKLEFNDVDDNIDDEILADHFVEAMDPFPLRTVQTITKAPASISDWTNQISDWQHNTLPIGSRLAPRWLVDGMVESPLAVAQSWHYWDVLPDGVIALAMCQFGTAWHSTGNLTNLLDATTARAALQSHVCYRHRPQDIVTRVLHTMMQIRDGAIDETGRPNLSMFYAHIEPDTGRAVMSSIGSWSSLIVSKYGYRPLNMGRNDVGTGGEFLGEQSVMNQETTLLDGEVLLLAGADWMGIGDGASVTDMPQSNQLQSAQHRIGASIKQAMVEGERSPLSALRRLLAGTRMTRERSAISLLHESIR